MADLPGNVAYPFGRLAKPVLRIDLVEELADAERRYVGKSSPLNDIRESIKQVDPGDRAEVGKALASNAITLTTALAVVTVAVWLNVVEWL